MYKNKRGKISLKIPDSRDGFPQNPVPTSSVKREKKAHKKMTPIEREKKEAD